MTTHNASVSESLKVTDAVTPKITRGKERWAYIYIMPAFTLTIEATLVQLITPIWSLGLSPPTPWSRPSQCGCSLAMDGSKNKLIGLKEEHENKAR
jgi:hypothetical protein